WFDMVGGLTVNPKGAKTVHVRTTGNDKNRFTIVLTCFADSRKLPPVIIFKGKTWPSTTSPPSAGVVVWFQEKGWMDELGMTHITDRAKGELRSGNTNLAVILGMANGGNGITKKRNLKRADLNMMCHWVLNTWKDVSEDIIGRAFKSM
ncbi:3017_t:CDS:2, partial [Scutellospora calospora]